jgi:rhodanese-related sulfurtransferase
MRRTITVRQLRERGEQLPAQLIDVRSASEFAAGHVPGAVNIPMEQIDGRLADLTADGCIVLVCQGGTRAALVADMLEPCRKDVAVLEGGTAAWIREGLPVVTSKNTRWSLERQVRLGAGLLVLAGVILSLIVSAEWTILSGFAGLGLIFAGLTDLCPMAALLGKMPWNRASHCIVTERT